MWDQGEWLLSSYLLGLTSLLWNKGYENKQYRSMDGCKRLKDL